MTLIAIFLALRPRSLYRLEHQHIATAMIAFLCFLLIALIEGDLRPEIRP
jgi:hypothetical protein